MGKLRFAPYFGSDKPIHGNPDLAQIEVDVYETDDGHDFYVRCMCSACYEIENVGIVEAMGEVEPGVYYMRTWHTVRPSGPWGPEEYDGGLEVAEE